MDFCEQKLELTPIMNSECSRQHLHCITPSSCSVMDFPCTTEVFDKIFTDYNSAG